MIRYPRSRVRDTFVRLLGVIFVVAFWSLGRQVVFLYGERGLEPACPVAARALGTVFRLHCSDAWLWWGTVSGAVLGGVLALGLVPRWTLVACWALYLSYVRIGQDFLSAFNYTVDYRRSRIIWNPEGDDEPAGVRLPLVASGDRFVIELPQSTKGQDWVVRLVPDSGADAVIVFDGTNACRLFAADPAGGATVAALLHLLRLTGAELVLMRRDCDPTFFEQAVRAKIAQFASPTANAHAREAGLAHARYLVEQVLLQIRAQAELKRSLGPQVPQVERRAAHAPVPVPSDIAPATSKLLN